MDVPYVYCVLVRLEMVDNTHANNFGLDLACEIFNPTKYDVKFQLVSNATYSLIGVNVLIFDKLVIEAELTVHL
jgi:hypothetical protein